MTFQDIDLQSSLTRKETILEDSHSIRSGQSYGNEGKLQLSEH